MDAARVLRNLNHPLVILAELRAVNFPQIDSDAVVRLDAPSFRHQLLVLGRRQIQLDGARRSRQDADHRVDVDRRVGQTIQQELLVHDVLAVLHQQRLDGPREHVDVFPAKLRWVRERRLHKSRHVDSAKPDVGRSALRSFLEDQAEVGRRVLESALKLLQVRARVLNARQGDEQPEDVVGAFKNPEDPQIPHDALQSSVAHEAHSAKDLNGLVAHVPSGLAGEDLGDRRFEMVIGRSIVHVAGDHVAHRLCGVMQAVHARDLLLNAAVRVELLAELCALCGVVRRLLDANAHRARQRHRHPEAAVVENVHRHLEAVAFAAEDVLDRDLHVFVVNFRCVRALDAHLLLGRAVATKQIQNQSKATDGKVREAHLTPPKPRSTMNAVTLSFFCPFSSVNSV